MVLDEEQTEVRVIFEEGLRFYNSYFHIFMCWICKHAFFTIHRIYAKLYERWG